MEFRHLRYFIAVAEEQHMGRAAARLHLSQPPLTRQIQQLEGELGVCLFERTPRGMELTQAGSLFLEEARNIQSVIERAVERTQRAGQGQLGRLDIGIFGSGILGTIPQFVLAFRNAYPEVNVVLHTMSKDEQIEALRQRRITIGFNRLLGPDPDITSELVRTEQLLLAINANHPLASRKRIPANALRDMSLILFPAGVHPGFVDKVHGICHKLGFVPRVSQEVGDAVTGAALVASGFGACLVPESATVLSLPGVVYRSLSGMPKDSGVDLSCIYRRDDRSPLLAAFLESIRTRRGH
ncbi:LysR family transcriptional regulator [Pseudoxanthomonas kalamensis DSM 18571]|uniref:LysR substrate-binding domain-containing protein n=1 Tax=Pseudoxanthomonas kalamensis TaxID=289483 RepID=UPI001390AE55|nr:LysR substrate-binding domain-containing protein [Pseudoxanthomonas kalamensis]KAF1711485.1 LysR family transcriptional regulator [Pseudoxanthomonas kalamensis DSM 18571]